MKLSLNYEIAEHSAANLIILEGLKMTEEKRRHAIVFDDEIPAVVREHVLQASGFALEVYASGDMLHCWEKHEELEANGEEVAVVIMEPILWSMAYTSSPDFAQHFITRGIPVICYSTGAIDIVEWLAGTKIKSLGGYEVSGAIDKVGKGNIEALREALKMAKAI